MRLFALTCAAALVSSPLFAACQQGPITEFFPAFANSVDLQKEVLAPTIRLSALDHEAVDGPELVALELLAQDFDFPLVPEEQPFLASGGSITYGKTETGEDLVTLSGDSGYLVSLAFTPSPCWTLREIIDESM